MFRGLTATLAGAAMSVAVSGCGGTAPAPSPDPGAPAPAAILTRMWATLRSDPLFVSIREVTDFDTRSLSQTFLAQYGHLLSEKVVAATEMRDRHGNVLSQVSDPVHATVVVISGKAYVKLATAASWEPTDGAEAGFYTGIGSVEYAASLFATAAAPTFVGESTIRGTAVRHYVTTLRQSGVAAGVTRSHLDIYVDGRSENLVEIDAAVTAPIMLGNPKDRQPVPATTKYELDFRAPPGPATDVTPPPTTPSTPSPNSGRGSNPSFAPPAGGESTPTP